MYGCDYCRGDKALLWENEKNYAFIDDAGEMLACANGNEIRFKVERCPQCGRRFMYKEDYNAMKAGDNIFYIDREEQIIEQGKVVSVKHENVSIGSVEIKFSGAPEAIVFYGSALGENLFLSQKLANANLTYKEAK